MMDTNKMQKMDEMMGMCRCHDCNTLKDCSMNMDCTMNSQKGLFCGMGEGSSPRSDEMKCMCTSCQVASDMGMSMMNFPCMGKK